MRFCRTQVVSSSGDALNSSPLEPMVAVLSDTFTVVYEDGRQSRAASVRLTDNYLSYSLDRSKPNKQPSPPPSTSDTSISTFDKSNLIQIPIRDLIGCHVMKSRPSERQQPITTDQRNSYDVKQPQVGCYLCLYSYPACFTNRLGLRSKLRRTKKTIIFQINKFDSPTENFQLAEKWARTMTWMMVDKNHIIQTTPTVQISLASEWPRIRNLLVLVNPASGPGKAMEIFEQRVAPVLVESGLKFEVMITKAAGNAQQYISQTEDLLTRWDGVVIVSGDGLLYEVFNGIMARDDWRDSIRMPIGVIPGGSGNGLAHAINYAVGDRVSVNPILASALNVACGRSMPMDLIKVTMHNAPPRYSFLSVGWGLVADIDIESERLRMVGGARFTIWALVRTLSLRKYAGRLSYLPVAGYQQDSNNLKSGQGRLQTYNSVQEAVQDESLEDGSQEPSDEDGQTFRPRSHSAPNDTTGQSNGGSQEYNNGNVSIRQPGCQKNGHATKTDSTVQVPALDEPLPDEWSIVEGDFVVVYSGHQTHLSSDCLFAPEAKLDDGIIWLLYIRGDVSRAQVLQFLTSLDSGSHVKLDFVHMVPVHAFRLEPLENNGRVTIDGELVECGPVQAEVIPSVARVMSR